MRTGRGLQVTNIDVGGDHQTAIAHLASHPTGKGADSRADLETSPAWSDSDSRQM